MLYGRFSEPAMYKILVVALSMACLVNLGCLLNHLASTAG
jgi:hypothetical protein